MSAAEWRQAESLSPDQTTPRYRFDPGTWGGIGDLFDRGGHTQEVTMWRPPAEPVSLDEWRARVALQKAQRALHVAIAAAVEPLPCQRPGPNLWLSEDRRQRRKAAELCQSCPVLAECGAVGAAAPLDTWGVFGGHDYGADDLAELQAVSRAAFQGRDGAPMRARRNELLRQLHAAGVPVGELAEVAGMSRRGVHAATARRPAVPAQRWRESEASVARRRARHEAEVAARADDPRVKRLRAIAAVRPLRDKQLQAERAELVAALWADDPRFWTNERLAVVVGVRTSAAALKILRSVQLGTTGGVDHGE